MSSLRRRLSLTLALVLIAAGALLAKQLGAKRRLRFLMPARSEAIEGEGRVTALRLALRWTHGAPPIVPAPGFAVRAAAAALHACLYALLLALSSLDEDALTAELGQLVDAQLARLALALAHLAEQTTQLFGHIVHARRPHDFQLRSCLGHIDLDFAGGGTIRLSVECLEARLQDLGAACRDRAERKADAGRAQDWVGGVVRRAHVE